MALVNKEANSKHAETLGLDPEGVSNAVLTLARGYKVGPLGYLWSVMNDPAATPSQRLTAATAILPYLHSRPAVALPPMKKSAPFGVMEVPIVDSMQQWMTIAAHSQAALKETVRV